MRISSTHVAVAGAALLAAGAVVQQRTRQAREQNPPQGSFVEVDGTRLHYVARGDGQPLVLLHGLGAMADDFIRSGLLERAAARYRVIAFDRPGYGHSDPVARRRSTPWAQAALLRAALRRLDVRRPIILGHSWGTLPAIAFALQFPGAARSLALVSGYYFPTARLDAALMGPPAIPLIGDLLRYTVSPLVARALWPAFLRLLFSPAKPTPDGPVPVWMALRPSQLKAVAMESLLTVPAAALLSRRYAQLTLPVTLVAGAQDRYVRPKGHSVRLQAMLPNARLELVPGAGHMVHHTCPDAVLAAIETSGGSGARRDSAPA
jgi:pimeloyl-ACP methyl ester carboxylesterase